MADLEAVLADVSYLMAMEKSRSQPAARASKRITLPDPRYRIPSSFYHICPIPICKMSWFFGELTSPNSLAKQY